MDLHGEGRRPGGPYHAVDIERRKVKVKGSGVEWNMMPMTGRLLGRIHPLVGRGGG